MSLQRLVCDVAIVGAGPAGIAAAVRAAKSTGGARVVVVDEGMGPGGQIWRPSRHSRHGRQAREWLARLDASGAMILRSTSVVDAYVRAGNEFMLRAESSGRAIEVESRTIVLSTGARELFLPFPGWTLPNVVGIGGAQALLKAGTDFRGKRVVMCGSGPLMLPVAASLARAGASLVLVAEQAPRARVTGYAATLWRKPAMLAQAVSLRWAFMRTPYATGTWITSARGDGVVREVTVSDGATSRTIACDVACVAFGLVPNTELARLLGCAVERGAVVVDDWQSTTIAGVYAAGEPTGIGGVGLSLVEGEIAGAAAAGTAADNGLVSKRRGLRRDALVLAKAFELRGELRALSTPDTIICRCEDVRLRDLDRRWSSPRQAKLYTRAGMGPCQGRICGAALECVMGWTGDTIRPPMQAARVSTLLSESSTLAGTPLTESGVH